MKIEAIRPLKPINESLPRPPAPAPTEGSGEEEKPRFAGERGKSEAALRAALERGVGAKHKRAHSARFGALLDEEA